METLKNILAAKKMVYLAAGSNPVGRDEGRGVHLWAILVILSLAMYLTSGLPNPKGEMGKETDPQETQQEPTWGQNGELRDEKGMDPENKIQKVAQELKRQELETKRKKMEQERMKSLSEQYEQLEKQSSDWSLPASSKNLFVDLVQEIATELGLSNC
ncbi:hypothetical protein DUI87_00919 [Hirundo rustica rustica]|uniref:Uncharacterized protein n=1 Tax=Hirundo rustica rustica TaxID=333673 RepID=A0A3M0L497_HIRRU|nr:hypothetical protein DUI87_00919 [Hirundo rustica rustica]